MSMLTPPGMGGKYRITGNAYPRMRRPHRRRRIALLAVAAVVALSLAGWGTMQLIDVFTGGEKKAVAGGKKPDCKPAATGAAVPAKDAAKIPKPASIKVNVYNATARGGLAKQVGEELKKRGFTVVKTENAPKEYDKKVKAAALLVGAPKSLESQLPVLGTQLKGAEKKADARGTQEVDLIIGDAFKSLDAKKDADAALAALAKPAPAPSGDKC
ncbi:membrane protein [Streptomyces spiroverticillatus]|uniref:Membrane protein n=1 Tax=Streptomyces finlayi TaxID=67296 RepID=A0A919C896_9ACTN|nr:LytR C-terminal domain-containing protein [Streptomyces finlayi]GHA00114.1 membrane protein [Streptomyces spiroverticillatus]GHC84630.1 membrane protein [Streptomyces finlayi]